MQPETKYARLGRERVAFQVMGQGPDLVSTPGSYGSMDMEWEDPVVASMGRRVSGFARLIRFDRRGTGASDPVPLDALPPWESYVEEVAAVMDAVGSERAVLQASFDAGPMAALFAATKPERTVGLILSNTTARYLIADDYPIGVPQEVLDQITAQISVSWGSEEFASLWVPSRASDERFRRWAAKLIRSQASPSQAEAHFRANAEADARALLPTIHVPTLVIHRANCAVLPVEHGRYVAEHILGAQFREIPGSDLAIPWEHGDLFIDLVEEFVTGIPPRTQPDRVLATVLFTDIVGSTELARRLGDGRWRELLDLHDATARKVLDAFQGRYVEGTGDGLLATFEGPGRAIRCAAALREELKGLDLDIRAGIHTGEVELRGDGVSGLAVHIAARVMAAAGAGEVLVSRTVRDVVVGSDIRTIDRGTHTLKGVEGDWQLFAVA